MAIVQSNGSSAVTENSTVNNGGLAINVGSSSVLSNKALGGDYQGVFGSTPVDNATVDYADKAINGGTFAHNHVSPIAKRVTKELGGVASTALQTSAGQPTLARSIHRQEVVTTTRTSTAIRAGNWNIYTGDWISDPTTATDAFWDIENGTTSATSTDQAASPTRSAPGELTYKLGQPVPVSVDYSSKNT